MFIWQVPPPGTVLAPSAEFTRLPERLEQTPPGNGQKEVINDDELVVWSLKEHKRKMADAAAVRRSLDGREAQRIQLVQTVQREVAQLRTRLKSIIESNQAGPEEEMLQRDEFCIDLEARQEVAEECERRSRELREKLKEEIASRAVIRNRLVKDFWDPTEVHMARLHCIEEERTLSVANYPFRSGTAAPDSSNPLLKKLRVLRDVQARESVWLTDVACGCSLPVEDDALNPINICGGQEDYLINWGRCRWELPQPISGTAESTKAAEDAVRHPEAEPQEDARAMERTASSFGGYISADPGLAHPCFPAADTTSADFLYDPTELVSSPRRRIQVNLLNEMCMDYKRAFNTVFDRVKGEKTKAVEHISERVHRIHAILKELKSEEGPPVDPAARELPTGESPESVLEVSDKEIQAKKWISKEERARLDAEAAAEAERLRKLQEDDGGRQKALITMMGGTLKTKKDLSPLEARVRLEREEWMDAVPEGEMDEDQKFLDVQCVIQAAFADQLAREKALAEEQEAYRTRLGEELEQLKAEIKESTAAFDDGLLKELYRTRVETDLK
ncbi:WD repeat domain 96, partial [Perkinsus olseni]